MSKLKDLLKIGTAVVKPFAPGVAGSVLDIVSKNIIDRDDPQNTQGSKAMAAKVDELEHAVLILNDRLTALENK